MKTLAIIAEYNPLHEGHLYQLHKAKEEVKATHTLVIMSGNFVQRGEPAIFDKFYRATEAIKKGADLVIELPLIYATKSAEHFARGAVGILHHTGVVDTLSFGHEAETLKELYRKKEAFSSMDEKAFKEALSEGLSYKRAKEKATGLTSTPNDTLAIKYLEALKYFKSSIEPLGIKRTGDYHSELLEDDFPSATALRKAIKDKRVLPEEKPLFMEDLGDLILKSLIIRPMTEEIYGVTEGIENAFNKQAPHVKNLGELLDHITSPRYSRSTLRRLLLHYLFNYTKKEDEALKETYYVRPLAFNEKGQELLKAMKGTVPMITNPARLPEYSLVRRAFHYDMISSNLYYHYLSPKHEAQMKPIKVENHD